MYFFHLQIISTFFMDAEFLQLNSILNSSFFLLF